MTQGPGARAARNRPAPSELAAGALCLAASGGFLAMVLNLPEGNAQGDVGPGALPRQIGLFGLICAAAYLLLALRGRFADGAGRFTGTPRALASLAILGAGMAAVPWLGLALVLALSAAGITLLFQGPKRWWRATGTGLALWLIATGLFERLLGLPLP